MTLHRDQAGQDSRADHGAPRRRTWIELVRLARTIGTKVVRCVLSARLAEIAGEEPHELFG